MSAVLQSICLFILVLGVLFVLLELLTRFDRNFLFFGSALITLAGLTIADLLLSSPGGDPATRLSLMRLMHLCSIGYFIVSLWYIMLLSNSFISVVPVVTALCGGLIALLIFTALYWQVQDGMVTVTGWYYGTYFPLLLSYMITALVLNIRGILTSKAHDRTTLLLHLAGLTLVIAAGLADSLTALRPPGGLPNFLILGTLSFSIVASLIFAERFLHILDDRARGRMLLDKAHFELQRSVAMQHVGRSTAMINHEIANYMMVLNTLARSVARREPLSTDSRESLAIIEQTTRRLTGYSREIVSFARSESLVQTAAVDPVRLLQVTVDAFFSQAHEFITITSPSARIFVEAEKDRLQQVFVNLLRNSIEARFGEESLQIRAGFSCDNGMVSIELEDNGIGCSREQMERLFEPFFTSKNGGTGLGMAITRSIIESHRGEICAVSKNLQPADGHGMIFRIRLPQAVTGDSELQETAA